MNEGYDICDNASLAKANGQIEDLPAYANNIKAAYDLFLSNLSGSKICYTDSPNRLHASDWSSYQGDIYVKINSIKTKADSLQYSYSQFYSIIASNENGEFSNSGSTQVAETGAVSASDTNAPVVEEQSFWDSIVNFFSGVVHWLEDALATIVDVFTSLFLGLVKLGEGIVDAVLMLGGTVCASISAIFGAKWAAKAAEWVKKTVAYDFTNETVGAAIYSLGDGWIVKNSWLDDNARSILQETGRWLGIAALSAVIPGSGAIIGGLTAGISRYGMTGEDVFQAGGGYVAANALGIALGVMDGIMGAKVGAKFGNSAPSWSQIWNTVKHPKQLLQTMWSATKSGFKSLLHPIKLANSIPGAVVGLFKSPFVISATAPILFGSLADYALDYGTDGDVNYDSMLTQNENEATSGEIPDPNQTLDPNETPDPNETTDPNQTPDPNETLDPNETQDPNQTPDPNETSGSGNGGYGTRDPGYSDSGSSGSGGDPGYTNQGGSGSGTTDPGSTDQGPSDSGTTGSDPGTTDPGTSDQGTSGSETPDPGTTDQGDPDPGTTDTENPDPGTSDEGNPDPGTSDSENPDPGTSDEGNPDPGSQDQGDSGTGDDMIDDPSHPKVSVDNQGPGSVTLQDAGTLGAGMLGAAGVAGGYGGGSYTGAGGYGSSAVDSTNPQYSNTTEENKDEDEDKKKDKYIFESMPPTVENPALDAGLLDNPQVEVTVDGGEPTIETPTGNVAGGEASNAEQLDVTQPNGDNTSLEADKTNLNTVLGLGGISAGLGVGGVYLAQARKDAEKEQKTKDAARNLGVAGGMMGATLLDDDDDDERRNKNQQLNNLNGNNFNNDDNQHNGFNQF